MIQIITAAPVAATVFYTHSAPQGLYTLCVDHVPGTNMTIKQNGNAVLTLTGGPQFQDLFLTQGDVLTYESGNTAATFTDNAFVYAMADIAS